MEIKRFNQFYFWTKVVFMILALYVYTKFTTLGDTMTYVTGGSPEYLSFSLFSSTGIMTQLGIIFYKYLRFPILSCFPFLLVSYVSIKYVLLKHTDLQSKFFFLLLFMPNFLIYTSVFSKEAISCIFCAILASWIISYLEGDFKIKFIYIVGIVLCAIFKLHFLPFILEAIFLLWFTQRIHSAKIVGILAITIWVFNIGLIYYFRDTIDEGAQLFKINFTWGDPKATRESDFFAERYGVFKHLLYGMFISFWGPTFDEMVKKPAQLFAGIESFVIVLVYGFLFLGAVIKAKFDAKIFWSFSFIFLGILMVHYPFGIFNPGSAVRYRQNFHLLFAILLVYLYKRNKNNVFKKKPFIQFFN